jgi:hypothetical protein
MINERYITAAEVEVIMGRKMQTLANERHEGRGIPYYKVGRSVRYKLSEVMEFMEKHRIELEPARLRDGAGA